MRFRLFVCFMGTFLLPAVGNALLVSDLPGTSQAATEATNTLNNWKESMTQMAAIQKTVSAIGTAQKGLTTAMTAITDFQATVADYQAQIAQAQADIKSAVNTVQNADTIAKGLADRAVNSVKDTAMSTVNGMKETAMSTVNSVKDTATSVKDQAVGMGEMAKDTAGIKDKNSDASTGTSNIKDEEQIKDSNNESVADDKGGLGVKASASDIVDTPSAKPSRRSISTGSTATVSGGGQAGSLGAVAVSSSSGVSQKASAVAAQATSNTMTGTMKQAVAAPQAVKAEAMQITDTPELARESADSAAIQMSAPIKAAVSDVAETSDLRTVTAKGLEALAPVDEEQVLKTQKALQSKEVLSSQAVSDVKDLQKTVSERAVNLGTAKADLKKEVKTVPAQMKTNVKNLKMPAKKIDNKQLKQIAPQIEPEKTARPARASFKTSSGYGQIRTSVPLAFAQVGGISLKGGTAMGNIMIVPRDIFIRCMLDYEQAAEKDMMDECLKKINDVRMSEVTEENTKGMIDNATADLYNSYAEMLASGLLEAFEVYNDSVDFYYKQIHPNQEVNNQRVTEVSAGWALSKDMNRLLDGRLNELNKLWGRQLLTKGFESYINSGIKTPEEQSDKKAPLNTNMHGKVVISSVLVDRCGVSATNPVIDEECLRKLAGDLKTNAADTEYGSWQNERGQIINEYASAYNQRAAKALAAVGNNFQTMAGLTGMDLSGAANPMEPDVLKKITDNNAYANAAAAKILDAMDLRASSIMLDSINRMLLELVPAINLDGTAS